MKRSLLSDLNASLRLGTESFDEGVDMEETESVEPIPEGETATAQDLESMDTSEAVDELTDDVDEEIESSESVDDLAVAVETAKGLNRPLSRFEAIALTAAYHQVTRKHYKDPLSMLPAREAHHTTNVVELHLVHESLKETATDLYKKAAETIKEIIKKIVAFIGSLINKHGALQKRFSNIYKMAKERKVQLEGKTPVTIGLFEMDGKVTLDNVVGCVDLIDRVEKESHFSKSPIDTDGKAMTADDSTYRGLIQSLSTKARSDVEMCGDIGKNTGQAPEEVVEFVAIPGNNFIGTARIGESDLLGLKLGKLKAGKNDPEDAEFADVSASGAKSKHRPDGSKRQTMVETPTKESIIKLSKECFELLDRIKRDSSANMRKLKAQHVFDDHRATQGGDEQHDTSDKTRVKLMVRYVSGQATFLRDFNTWSFNKLVGLAEFFEDAIKSDAIEGQSTEGKAEEPKAEAKPEEKAEEKAA